MMRDSRLALLAMAGLVGASTYMMATMHRTEAALPVTEEPLPGVPRLVDLGSERGLPCQMMRPVLDELRQAYRGKVQVVFIDVRKRPSEADRYTVRRFPTQILFDKNGQEVFRHVGFYPKESILTKFRELGWD